MNEHVSSTTPLPLPGKVKTESTSRHSDGTQRGLWQLILLGPRAWRRWWWALVNSIEHEKILAQVEQDASFSFNYNFMIIVASGIATIGLLLNSPAVIIGAMLISPLMGPIVASGVALATLDVELGRQSARTLLLGIAGAIAFTALIVLLSPVTELTPELLARTRPNLFDLVVAILSGAAGGYAMIRGKGGAIVGVAIATALMPPLATVGYGLVTQQWPIARGALLLFVTNMVAISLAIAAVAEWYGFGRGGLRKRFARQAFISLLILAPLFFPLFSSLKAIAFESFAQLRIRSTLETAASTLPDGQLGEVKVHFSDDQPPQILAILYTSQPQPALAKQLNEQLAQEIGQAVRLRLRQLRTADNLPLLSGTRLLAPKIDLAEQLRQNFPLPLASLALDEDKQQITLLPQRQATVDLATWQKMEATLTSQYPDWHLQLIPPPQALPALLFANGSKQLDDQARQQLASIVWALQRWQINEVDLTGLASSERGGSQRLATARASAVRQALAEQGISARPNARYPLPNQMRFEQEAGQAAYRAVLITLPPVPSRPKDPS
ncbi:MAG: TIGR00341 family protein [Dechloromonas sp.]|nr:TIGR00341 family protein [Dechloromonas sp.]